MAYFGRARRQWIEAMRVLSLTCALVFPLLLQPSCVQRTRPAPTAGASARAPETSPANPRDLHVYEPGFGQYGPLVLRLLAEEGRPVRVVRYNVSSVSLRGIQSPSLVGAAPNDAILTPVGTRAAAPRILLEYSTGWPGLAEIGEGAEVVVVFNEDLSSIDWMMSLHPWPIDSSTKGAIKQHP